jgi:phosphoribosylformylglycinamidine synthase
MGVGAKPILSTDVLFFGPVDYPHEDLPPGTMHPKRLMKGSVAGIRDYGNRMGIPTANGGVAFDEGYVGNPLIYAGTVGIMPRDKYIRSPRSGDLILLVGGKTGRDGIHGVTFASVELEEESEKTSSGAVQIGNPVEEKKALDGLVRARDAESRPLYSAVTDCGGGGLSSAIGEMGKRLGATVHLEKVPLKYAGLEPWEIWISEAQERMIFAVPPQNKEKILEIFENENCEANFIGEFRSDRKLVLYHENYLVCELEMDFLHGVPHITRTAQWEQPVFSELALPTRKDLGDDLKKMLRSPNVASKEWVIRQYDHEVQARTVIKPMHSLGPGDACVLKPLYDSWKGVVVSNGVNSKYCSDPYNMALSAIDEALRNNTACGGRRIAILDNFSWGSPENPQTMGALVEACKGCYDAAKGFGVPFISGKDSLHNEYVSGGKTIAIPHTLVISALGIIPDVRKAVTMDLKTHGSAVYIVGKTFDELGGSHYFMVNSMQGGKVPTVDAQEARRAMGALVNAMDEGLLLSCHDCSEGGIGVAAAEMAFAGGLGMKIRLDKIPSETESDDKVLFSESNSRFLVEVEKGKEKAFEEKMGGRVFAKIGETSKKKSLQVKGRKGLVVDESINGLRKHWEATFKW